MIKSKTLNKNNQKRKRKEGKKTESIKKIPEINKNKKTKE